MRVVEQRAQETGSRIERDVRDHPKRKPGHSLPEGVSLHDEDAAARPEAAAQPPDERRVDFQRDDISGALRERGGDDAVPRTDLEHQVLAADVSQRDELGGERATAKKVL